jgi:hypothetical protein
MFQAVGPGPPHPFHAHWDGAQLPQLPPRASGHPGCRLRDLAGHDAKVHRAHDVCVHRLGERFPGGTGDFPGDFFITFLRTKDFLY